MQFKPLTDFLDSLSEKGIVGSSFAMTVGGKTICEHYSGFADKEAKRPMAPDTLFRLFSMTKVFTNVALMQLYEKGRLILSDPLSDYLPEFSEMQVVKVKPNGMVEFVPAKNRIRVEDIMGMTAGLVYAGAEDTASRILSRKLEDLAAEKPNYTTRDYVKVVASCPLAYEPGTHWRYSTAHEVVGALVEVLSGERFSEYVDRHICRPLGLVDTFFHAGEDRLSGRLAAYYRINRDGSSQAFTDRDDPYRPDCLMDRGGAGMISTLGEYLRFADTLANGGTSRDGVRIIGSRTLDLMRTNRLSPEMIPDLDWPFYRGYGYGLGVRVHMDKASCGGGNPGEYGWDGAAGTIVFIDPEKDLAAVFMEQAAPNFKAYILPRLRNMIYTCAGL